MSLWYFTPGEGEIEGVSSTDAHSTAVLPPGSSLLCFHSNWLQVFLSTLSGIRRWHHWMLIILFPGFSADVSSTSGPLLCHCSTGPVQWFCLPSWKTGWLLLYDGYDVVIPYSRQIWQRIKFGGLVVYITTAKLKSAEISYSHIYMYIWRSHTEPPNLNPPIFLQ